MNAETLYQSPLTDLAPRGPDTLFIPAQMDELVNVIDGVMANAQAL